MAMSGNAQPFNREQPKPYKKNKQAHVQNTKFGMGDNYGTGVKAKLGKIRGNTVGVSNLKPKQIKTPPKSLA